MIKMIYDEKCQIMKKNHLETESKSSVIGTILTNLHTNKSNVNFMINFKDKFILKYFGIFSIHLSTNLFRIKFHI
jgi:hypothetical protein